VREQLRLKVPDPGKTMNPLSQSQKIVLEILGTEGAMTHKDIVKRSDYSPRTVRYALRKLKEKKLLIEKMNMHDMRQIIYQYRLAPSLQETSMQERSMADS
jgi:DNA-binding MarR family transcriptional regulator